MVVEEVITIGLAKGEGLEVETVATSPLLGGREQPDRVTAVVEGCHSPLRPLLVTLAAAAAVVVPVVLV